MALALKSPSASLSNVVQYNKIPSSSLNKDSISFASGSSLFPALKFKTTTSSSNFKRIVNVKAEMKSVGLSRKGLLQGGRWLSCTTRHIRIYVGVIDTEKNIMDQSQADTLSIILDPDNEFLWTEETEQRVYSLFTELVDNYAGADLTEYTLRLIGSDLEHYIRKMLMDGDIQYNLNCRVLNFSMGKPRVEGLDVEATAA